MRLSCLCAMSALFAASGFAFGQGNSPYSRGAGQNSAPPASWQDIPNYPRRVETRSPYAAAEGTVHPTTAEANKGTGQSHESGHPPVEGLEGCHDGKCCTPRPFWINVEYLDWWIKDERVPGLVGIAPAAFANQGVIPASSITPLVGTKIGYGEDPGMRVSIGAWLDDARDNGIEASYFSLEHHLNRFTFTSNGNPLLGPLFLNGPAETLILAADPGRAVGTVAIRAAERLYGGEVNFFGKVPAVFSDVSWGFVGFRYLQFSEGLDIGTQSRFLPNVPILGGSVLTALDSFGAKSQFYGPQVGVASDFLFGKFSLKTRFKFAVGDIHEDVDIRGSSSIVSPVLGNTNFVGGVLAQPTNIGHASRDRMAVLPELNLNFGYQVTSHVRTFVGYNFLYVSNVVRAGDQIDPFVTGTQIPLLNGFSPAAPATRPVRLFQSNDFWAEGITAGVELTF